MLLSFMTYMLGSRIGRYLLVIALVIVLLTFVYWKIYNKGVVSVKVEQTERAINNVLDKIRADEELFKLDADSRRIRLRKWAKGTN